MAKKKTEPRRYATHITTPAGERVYISGKSREELENKVLDAQIAMRAGLGPACDLTFQRYAETWLRAYKQGRVRESSYALLESNLSTHVYPFFGQMRLREITPLHIQLYLGSLTPYSKSLQQKCFRLVKGILRSAAENGLIARSPVQKEDRVTASDPPEEEPLTDDQAKALLEAVAGTRAYTFCLLALSTGMRRGEILGLQWQDIDLDSDAPIITVTHNKSLPLNAEDAPVTELLKTEAAHRKLPVSPQLKAHLLACRADSNSEFVLSMKDGRSLTKTSFRNLWRLVERRTAEKGAVARELGESYGGVKVSLDFDCHPHLLRHTYITKLFEMGLDIKQVQYLAGHSTPDMTMRVYAHYRDRMRAGETHAKVCDALSYLSA